jgi:hypothetical protein
LATIPGIGPIIALTLATEVDPSAFESGRHLAAWIGLTPKEHSTGGKQRMGGISRAGHERLRQLLVTGATAVIKLATRPGNKLATEWLLKLLQHKPRKLVAVALANKMARIGVSGRSEVASCCALDEGRSLGAALQEEASNHHERLLLNGDGRERHGQKARLDRVRYG